MTSKNYLEEHTEEIRSTNKDIIPVCIVVDTSKSMSLYKNEKGQSRMDRLNMGIEAFLEDIRNDDQIADSIEISFVTYGATATLSQKFRMIDGISKVRLSSHNSTGNTGVGVMKALDILNDEKKFLRDKIRHGYKQPWIAIFSDGRATGSDMLEVKNLLENAQEKTSSQEREELLTVIPVLISEKKDNNYSDALNEMKEFSSKRQAVTLEDDDDGHSFTEFFKVFSQSVGMNSTDMMFDKKNKVEGNEDNAGAYKFEQYGALLKRAKPEEQQNNEKPVEVHESDEYSRKVRLVLTLPRELEDNEVVKISYNKRGNFNGQNWETVPSKELNFLEDNRIIATLHTIEDIGRIRFNIEIFDKYTNAFIETLTNEVYPISKHDVYINLIEQEEVEEEPVRVVEEVKEVISETKDRVVEEKPEKKEYINEGDGDYLEMLMGDSDDTDLY